MGARSSMRVRASASGERARAQRSAQRRRGAAGFTLMELMVVVLLISILAVLAMPRMATARDDRLAFDYARQISSLVHRAHTRAQGRGAAHIVVMRPGAGNAGEIILFEMLDGVAPTAGPNPVSSCKDPNLLTNIRDGIANWPTPTNYVRYLESVNLNAPGIPTQSQMGARPFLHNAAGNSPAGDAVVLCVTPYGTTFYGAGSSLNDALGAPGTGMLGAQPFTDVLEIDVQRGLNGGTPVGLQRRVIVAGNSAPRIHSR